MERRRPRRQEPARRGAYVRVRTSYSAALHVHRLLRRRRHGPLICGRRARRHMIRRQSVFCQFQPGHSCPTSGVDPLTTSMVAWMRCPTEGDDHRRPQSLRSSYYGTGSMSMLTPGRRAASKPVSVILRGPYRAAKCLIPETWGCHPERSEGSPPALTRPLTSEQVSE